LHTQNRYRQFLGTTSRKRNVPGVLHLVF